MGDRSLETVYPHLVVLLILLVLPTIFFLRHNRISNRLFQQEHLLRNDEKKQCDFFSGRWVYDDHVSYPLYREANCSFLEFDTSFSCQRNGRRDLEYQKWRWQPFECDLPRFNGTVLLEKLRGKKLIFVGDSLNRNQWMSMLCLTESYLSPSSNKSITTTQSLFTFHASEYNATIGFYWSPLLVESNSDDPEDHRIKDRVIRINSIYKHARQWSDADILIFDSFGWWLEPTMTVLWGSFEKGSEEAIKVRVGMKHRRYEMALNTWSEWIEINWGEFEGSEELLQRDGAHKKRDYWGIATDIEMMKVLELTLKKLEKQRGIQVQYLNISQLSDYRIDAHPSIYRKTPPNKNQLADPISFSDCAHWCLPGVPDIWNQILYSYLVIN